VYFLTFTTQTAEYNLTRALSYSLGYSMSPYETVHFSWQVWELGNEKHET